MVTFKYDNDGRLFAYRDGKRLSEIETMGDLFTHAKPADQALRPERADSSSSLVRTQRTQGVSDTSGDS